MKNYNSCSHVKPTQTQEVLLFMYVTCHMEKAKVEKGKASSVVLNRRSPYVLRLKPPKIWANIASGKGFWKFLSRNT